MKMSIFRKGGVTPRAIHGDADKLGLVLLKLRQHLVVQRHLIAANRAPIRGIKREHDRSPPKFIKSEPLIRRAAQIEIRRVRSGLEYAASAPIHIVVSFFVVSLHGLNSLGPGENGRVPKTSSTHPSMRPRQAIFTSICFGFAFSFFGK